MRDMDPIVKFTERAKKVLRLAQEEAQHFQHNYIGTEHILLGLVREDQGLAARILKSLGADLTGLHAALETIKGHGEQNVLGEIKMTPNAQNAMTLASNEAHRLKHYYIGTEHLLLALTLLPESGARLLLQHVHISLDDIHAATIDTISQLQGNTPPSIQRQGQPQESSIPLPPQRDRFDKFSEQARRVLGYAQEEAQRFQHNYIGTEHLLLGIVREEDVTGARILGQMGIKLEKVRQAIEFIIGRGDRIVLNEIGLTPRAKKVIELAVDEARRLNHHYIGSEHILLGIVREGNGIASGVLESMGAHLENVRTATLHALNIDEEQIAPPTVSEDTAQRSTARQPQILSRWSTIGIDGFTFTPRVEIALMLAEREARRMQHNSIRPEHLLLGLIGEEQGIAAHVLLDLGIDLARARTAVEQMTPVSEQPVQGQIKPTQRTLAHVVLATDEAESLQQTQVGPEHLLLGLTRDTQGGIPELLSNLGTDQATVRSKTLAAIAQ